MTWSVIVLTGGTSSRMGRDKATLELEGISLLERTLSGVPLDVPVVVAGPEVPLARSAVAFARENPPGGGPVAGVDAAVSHVRTPVVVVLATDLPFVGALPAELAARLSTELTNHSGVDAVLATDASGHLQQLCGAYATDALRRAIAAGGAVFGVSMRSVVARLSVHALTPAVFSGTDPVRDIDTPADLAEFESEFESRDGETDG
jgi:molybdopterin-guanine dinucleotide biosynthesis protein A